MAHSCLSPVLFVCFLCDFGICVVKLIIVMFEWFNNWFYCFLQLMEVTGKNQDECMVALHDCNEDVSRAINFLLESPSDMVTC